MHQPTSIATAQRKQELRDDLRSRLATLDPERASHLASRVAERTLALPEVQRAKGILTCLSFGVEIDTWGLVDHLLALGRPIFVPRADPKDHRLHVHPYPCELRTLSFGLRQPPRGAPEVAPEAIDDTLDLVLVLGLGFDRQGYRLGYGSGYFDRFLASHTCPAIGLGFDRQLVDQLPRELHDIPMSVIVTERQTLRPGKAI